MQFTSPRNFREKFIPKNREGRQRENQQVPLRAQLETENTPEEIPIAERELASNSELAPSELKNQNLTGPTTSV